MYATGCSVGSINLSFSKLHLLKEDPEILIRLWEMYISFKCNAILREG